MKTDVKLLKTNKATFVLNFKKYLESSDLHKIEEVASSIRHSRPKQTIRDYINTAKFTKKIKKEIERDIIKKLFILVLNLVSKKEKKLLDKFVTFVKNDFTGYGKINNILLGITSQELLGKFLLNFAQKVTKKKEDIEPIGILCNEIRKFPRKEILSDFVNLILKGLDENKIDKLHFDTTIAFLSRERLLKTTLILLLEEFYVDLSNAEARQKRFSLAKVNLLEAILDYPDEDRNLPFIVAYIGGVFSIVPELQNLETKVRQKILKTDCSKLIELSMKNIHAYMMEKKKIAYKFEKNLDKKSLEITRHWQNQYEAKTIKLTEYLCDLYSKLLQIKLDAEIQKISKKSNIFKRIIATERYIYDLFSLFGISLVGNQNEVTKFDKELHQSLVKKHNIDYVKILIPGFQFLQSNKVKKIIKKAIVETLEP